jgi:hypothetical protein
LAEVSAALEVRCSIQLSYGGSRMRVAAGHTGSAWHARDKAA